MCHCVPHYFLLHRQISAKETSAWEHRLSKAMDQFAKFARFADGFGVSRIVLIRLHVRFHELGSHQLDGVPERQELASPIVGAGGNAQWAHRTAYRTARTIAQSE
jgi:hypothetical protein